MSRRLDQTPLAYQSGFRNHFASEALHGALPQGQNSPQRCAYGLYAEQLTGSAFTAPRSHNLRSWLYRIRPSVAQSAYRPLDDVNLATAPLARPAADPNQMRWDPAPLPDADTDFIDGLATIAVNGDAGAQTGCGVHVYACNQDMTERFFYNADGELLIVPQLGTLRLRTEFGALEVGNGEIAVIPRGVKFQVRISEGDQARGYVCENYGSPLELPGLGPIGRQRPGQPARLSVAGGRLRGPRGRLRTGGQVLRTTVGDPAGPLAAGRGRLARQRGALQVRPGQLQHHQYGQLRPSGSFDLHRADLGVGHRGHGQHRLRDLSAALDGGRQHLPPALLPSQPDERIHGPDPRRVRRQGRGLPAGGASLHNCMSPHGPDAETFEKASDARLEPQYQGATLAFMFESRYVFQPTEKALAAEFRQRDYVDVWKGLKSHFDPTRP